MNRSAEDYMVFRTEIIRLVEDFGFDPEKIIRLIDGFRAKGYPDNTIRACLQTITDA